MFTYALRRAAAIVPILFLIVTASFFAIRLAPGGPFEAPQALSPEVRANMEAAYGLDRPLVAQYARYLEGLLHGSLGPSLSVRDVEVSELIAQGLPVSATLGLASLAVSLLVGI